MTSYLHLQDHDNDKVKAIYKMNYAPMDTKT